MLRSKNYDRLIIISQHHWATDDYEDESIHDLSQRALDGHMPFSFWDKLIGETVTKLYIRPRFTIWIKCK